MIYCVPRINKSDVKINWLSKMNSYFTNILSAKTTKNLHITFNFFCFDQKILVKVNASEPF